MEGDRHSMNTQAAPSVEPRISDLSLVLDKLERIERALSRPVETRILSFSEVPTFYPNLTVREIRAACSSLNGPRKCKRGHVTTREIEAWLKREEQKQGVRST